MYTGTHYQLMAQYNGWMNDRLYTLCAGLSDAERRKDRGAFFKSIHGTLNHLFHGDQAWFGRFTDRPAVAKIGHEFFATFDELRAARKLLDDEIVAWADTLREEWLHAPFTYTSSVDGKTRTLATWVLVMHMFNHQTHHRGQLTTLLMQAGIDPGETDIPWLPALTS
jgi:uncharacterized damage-inducible protein DinB